jgi:hypothetical protein
VQSDPVGVTGHPWTEVEIEATVASYFEMLAMHFAGEHFTKVDFVRRLQALMPARNARAIESKFQNISACDRRCSGAHPGRWVARPSEVVSRSHREHRVRAPRLSRTPTRLGG